jgi:predicted transcriptional regulator
METTTIQIRKELKKKLEELKVYPNETMDQLIERLADNKIDKEPLSDEDIAGIEEGLADIKAGRVYTTKQLKKKLGHK